MFGRILGKHLPIQTGGHLNSLKERNQIGTDNVSSKIVTKMMSRNNLDGRTTLARKTAGHTGKYMLYVKYLKIRKLQLQKKIKIKLLTLQQIR